jgi:vancomycin resistance protein YoaR
MITTNRRNPPVSLFGAFLSALLIGITALGALLMVLFIVSQVAYAGRILPSVTMNGIDLGGLSVSQATDKIARSYSFADQGRILLTDGEKSWVASPAQLGFFLDPEASARNAYDAERGTSFLTLIGNSISGEQSISTAPVLLFNQKIAVSYLQGLAAEINQPIREASLAIQGSEVVVNQGQAGRVLDIQASLDAITSQIALLRDGEVKLAITESNPVIMDASQQAELTRSILSQPLTLTLPEGSTGSTTSWQLDQATLAQMLSFERISDGSDAKFKVTINKPLFTAYLTGIEPQMDQDPENARFIFNDETRLLEVIQPAKIGRKLDLAASLTAIDEQLTAGSHSIPLVFTTINPAVMDNAVGADLGITEQVSSYTTYFRGSAPDRVKNIQIASARFHGLMVAPGATLSMSDVLGDISLDNGYAEAPIILGDQTINGVGGGVCQVSTALFRTVFFGGYPINERHAHAYRVRYYEQTASGHNTDLAGLDATVFVPLVDFKFTNDSTSWLLMETYVNPTNYTLTWKFYSTSDGRTVDWQTTGLTNLVEPPDPTYRENPDLPTGKIKQVDWEVQGADVEVTRDVMRNGEILYHDKFATHYQAWRDIYEYGPGTELPNQQPSE